MAKAPAPKSETRMHKALGNIQFDGDVYAPGEDIEVDRATFDLLAAAGALTGKFEDGEPVKASLPK